MNNLIAGAADWFDDRTGLVTAVKRFVDEDIPASSGWHQVFGSVALFLFLVQVFTGILLAFNYVPQPGASYFSLQAIINELTGGRIIRGLHHWGASVMVVVVVIHMIQAALWGPTKSPVKPLGSWESRCCCLCWVSASRAICCPGTIVPTGQPWSRFRFRPWLRERVNL